MSEDDCPHDVRQMTNAVIHEDDTCPICQKAEIARLRADCERYRDLAGEQQTKWATRCVTAEDEVARLRAELAVIKALHDTSLASCDTWKEAAHRGAEEIARLKNSIDTRLNDWLCEMKPDYDDSIVGFNEAWDIVRKAFKEFETRAALASTRWKGRVMPTEAEIEAAARAIRAVFAARMQGAGLTPTAWDNLKPFQRDGYREEAKAALLAALASRPSEGTVYDIPPASRDDQMAPRESGRPMTPWPEGKGE